MDNESKIELIHFRVKDVRMCARLEVVEKVLPLMALEKVPNAPLFFAGLMNIGGRNIPVIDAAIRCGIIRDKKYSVEMSVLLCAEGSKRVGIIVDDILEMTDFDVKELQLDDLFIYDNSAFQGSLTCGVETSLLMNMRYFVEFDFRL